MSRPDLNAVVAALRQVLPESGRPVALHEPAFGGNEWSYVKQCLDEGMVSSIGTFVDRFERMLADYTGAAHAVAVVNGTAALHVCLRLVGVQENDEVLLPALTFVATANAVRYCNAAPHFVDSSERTLGVDPVRLEAYLREAAETGPKGCVNRRTGRRIRALVVMHTFGHPAEPDALADLCRRFGIELVEDAAQSLGSRYRGRHTGTWGRVAALSFNGNKIVTTGGGGAILTSDAALAARAKHLTTTAKVPHRWAYAHDEVGFNYRLPNVNAAIGCAQIEQLPAFVERKRSLARHYQEVLCNVAGVRLFQEPPRAESNYWLNALILDDADMSRRDALLELTQDHRWLTRPVWTLLHRLPMYRDCPRMELPVAERLEASIVNLPSSASLRHAEARAVNRHRGV
ncbi:MAG: LegC family aminotransferase [Gammaproteobacteria bacterium]|nr:MAG: LegC family aminotransferase [Gammaproteobacteria bacterium]